MKVNWFTVVAQIINFIALVWLLSRYLYKPILKAIEEREMRIKGQLEDAKAKAVIAESEKEEFRIKNEKFDKEKDQVFKEVIEESARRRQELLEQARKDGDSMRIKLEASLKETEKNLNEKIARRIQQEVFEVSRKIVSDIAGASLEEQAILHFLNQINHLPEEEKNQFTSSLKSKSKILIRSAFGIDVKLQSKIEESLEGMFTKKAEFQYSTMPDLICGIELVTDGFKLGWNISSYFNSLEKNLSEVRNEKIQID